MNTASHYITEKYLFLQHTIGQKDPIMLVKIIDMIDSEQWLIMGVEVKVDIRGYLRISFILPPSSK